MHPVRVAGFLSLVAAAAALLAEVAAAPTTALPGTLLVGTVGTASAVAVVEERERAASAAASAPTALAAVDRGDVRDALAVVVGAVCAHVLSVHAGFGPVLGSALVGVAAALAFPEADAPAYCGSFVGMASAAAFPSLGYVALAGAVSGIAYVASAGSFAGVGGKLGTLALFGCLTTAAVVGVEGAAGGSPAWDLIPLVVPVAATAALLTAVANVRLGLGPVLGSGLVGVLAALGGSALDALSLLGPEISGTLATAGFCASFVGMTSPSRIAGPARMAVAGAVSGAALIAVAPAVPGMGGTLGTVALVSCLGVVGARRALRAVGR